jgi:phosphate transport system substrate-binding protein
MTRRGTLRLVVCVVVLAGFAHLPASGEEGFGLRIAIAKSIDVSDVAEILHRYFKTKGAYGEIVRGSEPTGRYIEIKKPPAGVPELLSLRVVANSDALSGPAKGAAHLSLAWFPREALQHTPAVGVRALQPLTVFVNPDNPISKLSAAEVEAIVSGTVSQWSVFPGGSNETIKLLMPAWGSDAANLRSFGMAVAAIRPDIALVESLDDMEVVVKRDRGAVAIVAGSPSGRGMRRVPVASNCGQPFYPTAVGIVTGDYPFVRQVGVQVTTAGEPVAVTGMVSWFQSELAAARLETYGLYRQGHLMGQLNDDNVRLQSGSTTGSQGLSLAWRNATAGARPTSFNFTFAKDSASLGEDGQKLLQDLADWLAANPGMVKRIQLLGHSDHTGDDERNMQLSHERAETIAAGLAQMGVVLEPAAVMGIANIAAVGCQNTEQGRQRNRRVEVWVKG